MTRTVVAIFDDFESASDAVRELVENSFVRDNVSLMSSDASGEYGKYLDTERDMDTMETDHTKEGAGVGAGIGAVLGGVGGLLVGLGALAIPGIGPVIAAGPLAAALSGLAGAGIGAVAGGVTGGIIGALVDMGVPEETAHYYAEGVRRGGTLVTVRASDDMTDRAVDILNKHNPIDVNERAVQWRESGWTGFDTNAGPYMTTESAREPGAQEAHLRSEQVREGEEQLWPRDEYRPADETSGTEMERQLWQGDRETQSQVHDFTHYDPSFRRHYETTMAGPDYTYDQYIPAYRYGYDLAVEERYVTYDWGQLEPEARRYWEERNPGTWDRFKNAVRHAWEEIKDTVS